MLLSKVYKQAIECFITSVICETTNHIYAIRINLDSAADHHLYTANQPNNTRILSSLDRILNVNEPFLGYTHKTPPSRCSPDFWHAEKTHNMHRTTLINKHDLDSLHILKKTKHCGLTIVFECAMPYSGADIRHTQNAFIVHSITNTHHKPICMF